MKFSIIIVSILAVFGIIFSSFWFSEEMPSVEQVVDSVKTNNLFNKNKNRIPLDPNVNLDAEPRKSEGYKLSEINGISQELDTLQKDTAAKLSVATQRYAKIKARIEAETTISHEEYMAQLKKEYNLKGNYKLPTLKENAANTK